MVTDVLPVQETQTRGPSALLKTQTEMDCVCCRLQADFYAQRVRTIEWIGCTVAVIKLE